jgi:superfamily II DNA or RNA helicase
LKPKEVTYIQALRNHLERHDEYLAKSEAHYAEYTPAVQDLTFQTEIAKQAVEKTGFWAAELATGIGKTIIAARIAAMLRHKGPTLYICANPTALGDVKNGIINKFHRVYQSMGIDTFALGERNDVSIGNDVSFVTPAILVRLVKKDPERIHALLKRTASIIIDEAHHFPEDNAEALKIYGQVYAVTKEYAAERLVFSMTGTWGRLDKKVVMGQTKPNVQITVQGSVDLERCPEVYAIQVILDIVAKKATHRGDLYEYHLHDDDRSSYYDALVDCLYAVKQHTGAPFAAFVRLTTEAYELVRRYNERVGTEGTAIAAMTSRTSIKKRQEIIQKIDQGTLAGYITCAVGEEALDLPRLGVVHLIRRTSSINKNMQAVGRTFRLHKEKKCALIIDYQMMIENLAKKFVGINPDEMLEPLGSRMGHAFNGGPLVKQKYEASFEGFTMAEERAIVVRRNMTDEEKAQIIYEQEEPLRQAARDQENERVFEDVRAGFLEGFYACYHLDVGALHVPLLEFPVIRLPEKFADAIPVAMWVPTHNLAQAVAAYRSDLQHYPSWRRFVSHAHSRQVGATTQITTAARLTLNALMAVCRNHIVEGLESPRDRFDTRDREGDALLSDTVHNHDGVIATIIAAYDQGRSRRRFWERNEFDDEVLKESGQGQSLSGIAKHYQVCQRQVENHHYDKAFRAAWWVLSNGGGERPWHYNQTDVFPVNTVDTHILATSPRVVGKEIGRAWAVVRLHYSTALLLPTLCTDEEHERVRRELRVAQDEKRRQRERERKEEKQQEERVRQEKIRKGVITDLTNSERKQLLLARAAKGDVLDPRKDKKLYQIHLLYINPKHRIYDANYVEAMADIDRSWLARSNHYDSDGYPRRDAPPQISVPATLPEPRRYPELQAKANLNEAKKVLQKRIRARAKGSLK